MANQTNYLKLVLPANNEFTNTWDVPVNENFVKVDQAIEAIDGEIQSARGSRETLAEFLSVGHNPDGTLKASQEQADAINSQVYGEDDGTNNYTLKKRADLGDKEVFDAREGEASLLANLARRTNDFDYPDRVLDGAKTVNGVPNFLSSSAAEFILNADPTPITFNIAGEIFKLQDDLSVTVTGGDGPRYLVAKKPSSPFVVRDRSVAAAGITTQNALNNNKVQVFQDAGSDFVALRVRPGMILRVLNSQNAGDYIIDQVGFDSNVNQLLVVGRFTNPIGSLNFIILDPLRPEFSVETAYTVEAGKCIIGEGQFSGGALISDLTYAFKGKFESTYLAIDVSTLATFEQEINHNLGFIPKDISFFASQSSNESTAELEPLSTSLIGNDLDVTINDTLSFTPGVFSPGTTDASYTPGSLTGTVDGSITGNVFPLRSVQVKVTRTKIFVKNVRNNHFYRDYAGTDRSAGFLKVVCK